MKTAISIPNPIFEAAEKLASQLNMSRSELYTTAVAAYIANHQQNEITAQLNQVYGEVQSSLDPVLAQLQVLALPLEEW